MRELRSGSEPNAPANPEMWHRHWESSFDASKQPAIANLLARCFPDTPSFDGTQSWAGARPELRIVGIVDDRPIAHAGIVRRFIRSPSDGGAVLVGDVGLVAVDPAYRGKHVGADLMDTVASTLFSLRLPYGFLTCGPDARPFYERCGWAALLDRPVHSININHQLENHRCNGMVLPVIQSIDAWPAGSVHRDGQEI